jgi:hypothetical protein
MSYPAKSQQELDDETPCPHPTRAGIVTNQPNGYDPDRACASVTVCPDPSCRARAMGWVYKVSGEHGVYVSDSDRKKHGTTTERTTE